jgi:hypothetical protein
MINTPEKFKKIAPNYYYQCISNMICAKVSWCDFISYDPRVQQDYQMFIYRLELTEEEKVAVENRVAGAFEYMRSLVKEIEAAKPKLLLG